MNSQQELVLENIVLFLQKFSWLHNFPVIRIFSLNVIDKLPKEWKTWFEDKHCNLHILSSLGYKDISCSSLKSFIRKSEEYSLASLLHSNFKNLSYKAVEETLTVLENNYSPSPPSSIPNRNPSSDVKIHSEKSFSIDHPWKIIVQVNEKKKHEVEELSKFVWKIKRFTKTDQIFDIGSGLGYLGLYLHLVYGFRIIGAEGSSSNLKSSLKLKDHCLKTTCPAVKFTLWNLHDDNETIDKTKIITESTLPICQCSRNSDLTVPVMEHTNSSGTYAYNLVSLHSCADLSPMMLKIFINNNRLSSLVLLSCCYHKMIPLQEMSGKTDESVSNIKTHYKFKNIPLSSTLDDILRKTSFEFNTSTLRLSAEESLCQWRNRTRDKLEEDLTSIAYRAILQTVCEQNNLQLKKRRRHCGKKTSYKNFEEYAAIIFQDYSILTSSGNPYSDFEHLTSQLNAFYSKVKEKLKYIGLIRVLQLHLQPVIEALILLDRLLYLKENGFSHSGIVELFDSSVSPRNKAIVAFREKYVSKI